MRSSGRHTHGWGSRVWHARRGPRGRLASGARGSWVMLAHPGRPVVHLHGRHSWGEQRIEGRSQRGQPLGAAAPGPRSQRGPKPSRMVTTPGLPRGGCYQKGASRGERAKLSDKRPREQAAASEKLLGCKRGGQKDATGRALGQEPGEKSSPLEIPDQLLSKLTLKLALL